LAVKLLMKLVHLNVEKTTVKRDEEGQRRVELKSVFQLLEEGSVNLYNLKPTYEDFTIMINYFCEYDYDVAKDDFSMSSGDSKAMDYEVRAVMAPSLITTLLDLVRLQGFSIKPSQYHNFINRSLSSARNEFTVEFLSSHNATFPAGSLANRSVVSDLLLLDACKYEDTLALFMTKTMDLSLSDRLDITENKSTPILDLRLFNNHNHAAEVVLDWALRTVLVSDNLLSIPKRNDKDSNVDETQSKIIRDGLSLAERKDAWLSQGLTVFLAKPYQMVKVHRSLEQWLSKHTSIDSDQHHIEHWLKYEPSLPIEGKQQEVFIKPILLQAISSILLKR